MSLLHASILSKLNPFNSLFGRIFVWFWLATGLMVIAVLIIVRQVTDQIEIAAPTTEQLALGDKAVQTLTDLQSKGIAENRAIRRISERGRWLVAVFDQQTRKPNIGFPRPLAPNVGRLKDYLDAPVPVLIRFRNTQFIGPIAWSSNQAKRLVFVGRLLPRSENQGRTYAFIFAGISALVLGSLFCFFLVWHLTKPINQISLASRRFAKGDLSSRVQGLEQRFDEVGKLASDFNQMALKIETILNSQKTLLANVSHELRTPLTRMQLAVALIEGKVNDNGIARTEAVGKYLERLEADIQKMDKMIEHVLNIAKISSEGIVLDLRPIDISQLVNQITQDAQLEAQSLNTQLKANDFISVLVNADKTLLGSALENVIRNAIRFASKTVVVSIISDSSPPSDKICIVVEDDGTGLSSSHIKQLFEPFYRAHNPDKNQHAGSGLGLAIAKAAVDAHKGKIWAEMSALGGLKVVIQLNLALSSTNETN